MIDYLIKSSLCLMLILAIYFFLLEKEKIYKFNRFYLLFGLVFSVLVPFIPIKIYEEAESAIGTLEVSGTERNVPNTISSLETVPNQQDYFLTILLIVYSIITAFFLVRFIKNLYFILKTARRSKKVSYQGAILVLTQATAISHTFLNYIFINEEDYKADAIETRLISHELAHVRQKHTYDILLVELFFIILWFNPIILLYRKAIQLNHEFLADEAVLTIYNSVTDYQTLLLSKIGLINKIPLTNSFNYLITKKRLIMMTKQVNKTRTLFKKIALLPLLALLVFFFSTKVVAVLPASVQQFTSVEISPQFPGGMDEFPKFIMANIISPPTISGTTKVTFYIDKDGTVKIPASSRESEGINKNAILTVLAKSPKWHPAVQNGNLTKVSYVLTVHFRVRIIDGDTVNFIIVDKPEMINKEMVISFEKTKKDEGIYIEGTVTNKDGEPIVGASVRLAGSDAGTASGKDGHFSLVLSDSDSLTLSCVGYATKRISL